MKISDDKVIEIIMDTHEKVGVIDERTKDLCEQGKDREKRIQKLERTKKESAVKKGAIIGILTTVGVAFVEFVNWLRGG